MVYQTKTYSAELQIPGEMDVGHLLQARDGRISVPFWGSYIPYGLGYDEPLLCPNWLYVENVEQIGKSAVRLSWFNDSDNAVVEDPQEHEEESFGVVTYNNSIDCRYILAPKTWGIILENTIDPNAKQWRATLATEDILDEPARKAYRHMLGKLGLSISRRYDKGRL